VVLRPVEVRVRVLVVEMVGILRVAVFVFVVFGVAGDLVMTFAVRMRMGVLVPGVGRVVQVVVLMDRVLGVCFGHAVTPFLLSAYVNIHVCTWISSMTMASSSR
jgi:hypothetical protein